MGTTKAQIASANAAKKASATTTPSGSSSLSKTLTSTIAQAKNLGIDTGKAQSVLDQTKAQGSTAYKGSSYETSYNNSISSADLAPAPKINLPSAPASTDVGDMLGANNKGLANPAYNITSDGKGTLSVATPAVGGTDASNTGYSDIFKSYLAESQKIAPVNSADIYNAQYKADKIAQKQQDVSNITGQLNTIVANRDANLMRVEGQGRGIPEAIIGGQQAQINKEAAIAALPVQAQLAAAQGNLALAQDHLDTMVKLKIADATEYRNYKSKLLDSVYDFATASEKRRLDELKVQNDRKYEEKKDFIKAQGAALSSALAQGAPSSIISAIKTATDTNEVINAAGKYNGDLLAREAQRANIAQSYASVEASKAATAKSKAETEALANPTNKTLSGKPQTEFQAKSNGFADRALDAEAILKDSGKFSNLTAIGGFLPNALKSTDRQKFDQSKLNFINAVLRLESGATITPDEFAKADAQYFPQYGDHAANIALKAANRNTAINNLYRDADMQRPAQAGDIIEAGGKRYKVGDDGVTLSEI